MSAAAAEAAGPAHAASVAGLPAALQLEIVTTEARLVTDIVDEVVLPGAEGYLGVLPGHTPLLTSLGIGAIMYRRGSEKHYLAVAWGFAEVLPDRVTILAEIAEKAETIDRGRAEQARDRALEQLRGRNPDTDFDRAQVSLEKALIRIRVSERAGPNESV